MLTFKNEKYISSANIQCYISFKRTIFIANEIFDMSVTRQ